MENKVSHICIVDEEKNIYFENNKRLKGLSFIWWKLENWEDSEEWALRELFQETGGFFNFKKWILDEIENNSENVDWIIWDWKLYWLKISKKVWDLLIGSQKNIVKVNIDQIDLVNISEKLNKENLIKRIKLTIKKYLENENKI